MDEIDQAKPGSESVEVVKPLALQQLPLPRELASYEIEDIIKLEKQLVQKLDSYLLPAVILLFLMNILDRWVVSALRLHINHSLLNLPRNNIANAKIAGLPQTLGISNNQYNTCLMIFYVGCEDRPLQLWMNVP